MSVLESELAAGPVRLERAPATRARFGRAIPVARLALAILFVLPLLLLVTGAFRPDAESFRFSGSLSVHTLLPAAPTFTAFRQLADVPLFGRHLMNTVAMGVVLATTSTVVAALTAYPLARMRFRGREALFFVMVATVFLPFDTVIPPLYLVIRDFGLANSFWGLLLPWIFAPLGVYLLRQAMQEIPTELEEAAIVDGAGLLGILRDIIAPNIRPALATVWVLEFIFVWDWSLWPLIAMQNPQGQMIQVAIMSLFSPYDANYSLVFAASLVAVVPVVVVYVSLQRFFMNTLVFTGGK